MSHILALSPGLSIFTICLYPHFFQTMESNSSLLMTIAAAGITADRISPGGILEANDIIRGMSGRKSVAALQAPSSTEWIINSIYWVSFDIIACRLCIYVNTSASAIPTHCVVHNYRPTGCNYYRAETRNWQHLAIALLGPTRDV